MSGSELWQVFMFTCRCPNVKSCFFSTWSFRCKTAAQIQLGVKSSYTTLIHFTPLCATFAMITYTSSWWVMRSSLQPVPYSRLLWIRSSGLTVTDNKNDMSEFDPECRGGVRWTQSGRYVYWLCTSQNGKLLSCGLRIKRSHGSPWRSGCNHHTANWLIYYSLFYVPRKNFSLIWRRQHYW